MSQLRQRRALLLLTCLVGFYLALATSLLGRQGIQWDEATDLKIAESYYVSLGTVLTGSPDDAVNVRLPMFAVASLQLIGAPLDIATARLASVLLGALTLVGVFVLSRIELDDRRGLIAVALLAANPLFLAFSTVAFTEGDIFITCAMTWTLTAHAWLWQRPTRIRGLIAGVSLGLALSSKISAIAIFPALALATCLRDVDRLRPAELARAAAPWIAVGFGLAAWLALELVSTRTLQPNLLVFVPKLLSAPLTRLLLITAALGGIAIWSLRRRDALLDSVARVLQPLAVACATFFVVPPVHTTNGWILASLWREATSAGSDLDLRLVLELAQLHLSVLWIKPSLGIGSVLLIGVVVAAFRCRRRIELRAPLMLIASYAAFLLYLPWGQVRYVMPLLPLLAFLAGDLLAGWYEARRRLVVALAAGMAILCGVDFALSYPDLNLNGHQWLGTRYWGGRPTLGYRAIGQVGSDGLEQSTRWAAERAKAGETVVFFSIAGHIVARSGSADSPARWVNGTRDRGALIDADWVITHVNDDIRDANGPEESTGEVFQYPFYDRKFLISRFGKAYTVDRRFGIEVSAVWRRL